MVRFKLKDVPKGDFHLSDVANKFYPECIGSDSCGRTYNKASATVARVLRRMPCIMELDNGYFYNASV